MGTPLHSKRHQIEHIRTRRESQSNGIVTNHTVTSKVNYPWGHIYRARVWCSVLTMWPERRQNIEVWCYIPLQILKCTESDDPDPVPSEQAVIGTWGSLCDRIVFAVDNASTAPTTTTTSPQAKSYFNDEIRAKLKAMDQRKEELRRKHNKTQYEWEEAPDSFIGFDFLKLALDGSQSEVWCSTFILKIDALSSCDCAPIRISEISGV